MSRELLQKAIDALETCDDSGYEKWYSIPSVREALIDLKSEMAKPERKPMTEEELLVAWQQTPHMWSSNAYFIAGALAAEEFHGIIAKEAE